MSNNLATKIKNNLGEIGRHAAIGVICTTIGVVSGLNDVPANSTMYQTMKVPLLFGGTIGALELTVGQRGLYRSSISAGEAFGYILLGEAIGRTMKSVYQ